MNEFDYADRVLTDYKVRGNEIVAKICPICHGGSRNDKYTFYLNYDKHAYKCHRGSCGATGTFSQLAKEIGERAEYMKQYENSFKPKKEYKKPTTKLLDVATKAEQYIQSRGISKQTMEHFGIKSDKDGNIIFPYCNEKNVHEMSKFRVSRKYIKGKDTGMKMWQDQGGRPILFGMNLVDEKADRVIITEGEFDCMCVYECGHTNVVSIPFGVENFEWVNECWEWLERFKSIVIMFDNDEPGEKCTKEVVKKLGIGRVEIAKIQKCNDVNELMLRDGKAAVTKTIEKAEAVPMKHFERLADIEEKERDGELYGLKKLDEAIGGCMYGDLNVWTGKRGGAKSTILNQTAIDCIDQGNKIFVYSGELSNNRVRTWLEMQMCNGDNLATRKHKVTGVEEQYVPAHVAKVLREWYKDNLFVFGDAGGHSEDDLLEVLEYAYRRYDVKRFIIDNLKTVKLTSKAASKYDQQGAFIARLKDFCNKYDVHVDLVVHPRKTDDEMKDEDVGGSADIIDLADNVIECTKIKYSSLPPSVVEYFEITDTAALKYMNRIRVLKNREYGNAGFETFYKFNPTARRIEGKFSGKLTYSYCENLERRAKEELDKIIQETEVPF